MLNFSPSDVQKLTLFLLLAGSNSANYNGAWSVYPFFESGAVIVSGMEQGLFVLRPNLSVTSEPSPTPSESLATPKPTSSPSYSSTTEEEITFGFP